jgi:hypothetical protein
MASNLACGGLQRQVRLARLTAYRQPMKPRFIFLWKVFPEWSPNVVPESPWVSTGATVTNNLPSGHSYPSRRRRGAVRRLTDTDRGNQQTQTPCVVRGMLLSLEIVRSADYLSRRVAMRSVGTSDVEITSGALHRDDKALQALQLHFGSLSCVYAMESGGSDSTFDEEET